jgi:hypothetical protein
MERDNTQDWLVAPGSAPPLLSELEARIDEALVIARASEEAVGVVGAAAIDAAKEARRAAELAERASALALRASARSQPQLPQPELAEPAPQPGQPELATQQPDDAGLQRFTERANRVMARLRAIERRPNRPQSASAAAADRRGRH